LILIFFSHDYLSDRRLIENTAREINHDRVAFAMEKIMLCPTA
jgi:hypothetical protein